MSKGIDVRLALEEKLPRVVAAHPEVEGVILLSTMSQKDGRSWRKPRTLVQLFKVSANSGDWKTLSGRAPEKVVRGNHIQKGLGCRSFGALSPLRG